MKWFRLHSDVINDPKIQRMPVALRWHWVAILCLANEQEPRGYVPSAPDVAFALRVSEAKAKQVIAELLSRGLLDIAGHAINTVVTRGGADSTDLVSASPAESPDYTMPAVLAGAGVLAVLFLTKKKKRRR